MVIGWKIYEITGSAFDLGLVGLIQFVPAVVLTLLIGHAADRYDRRLIVRDRARRLRAGRGSSITVALLTGALSRDLLFAAVFLHRLRARFRNADRPSLWCRRWCRRSMLARAVAAWTSANQVAVICGPALGGLLYVVEPGAGDRRCASSSSAPPSRWSAWSRVERRAGASRAADAVLGAGRLRIHPRAIAACSA